MMWSALSNLFVLPFLLVISIPLALSASITAFLALTTLFLRALAVYFELSLALLANFFLFPAHSPASASFLALSGATTPAVDRSPSRTSKHPHHYYQANAQQSSTTKSWHAKEVVVEDYFFHNNHPHGPAGVPSHEVISSFISGNAERDFEGVGGWRTPLTSRKKYRAPSASSVGYNSSEEELNNDDQAWVSINKRLELPSKHLNLASANASPVIATVESVDHRHQQQQRPRLHRRSVTTPLYSISSSISDSPPSTEQTRSSTQLQTSRSSAGLESLPFSSFPRPSTSHAPLLPSSSVANPLSSHDAPFLMTPTSFGADYKMVHYPSLTNRRRRSSGSSSAAAAKAMSLTGLGLS